MRTEIDLPNPQERLYPGMYAEVSLEMDTRSNVLTLPAAAVGSDVMRRHAVPPGLAILFLGTLVQRPLARL